MTPGTDTTARTRWVLRVWLPDRPGSLAGVAGALSEAGADVVAIDVVERGAQTAIDDIAVDIGEVHITDVVTAVSGLDGVGVEDVRPRRGWRMTQAEVLREAANLMGAPEQAPLGRLTDLLVDRLGAEWAVVTDAEGHLLAGAGRLPDLTWIRHLSTGLAYSGENGSVGDGVVFEPLEAGGLIVCRSLPEFLGREVEEIGGWAHVAQQVTLGRASPATSPGPAATPAGPGHRDR